MSFLLLENKNRPAGFTLIELIVVIAIVGILAAVAMPRLIAAQRDARIAKMQAVYGGIRSAMMMARGRCELDRANPAFANTNDRGCIGTVDTEGYTRMDGMEIAMINNYPRAKDSTTLTFTSTDNSGTRYAKSILTAAQVDVTNDGFTVTYPNADNKTLELTLNGAITPRDCIITYYEAKSDGTAPDGTALIMPPNVTLKTEGC